MLNTGENGTLIGTVLMGLGPLLVFILYRKEVDCISKQKRIYWAQ
jgi:hypothetical protein